MKERISTRTRTITIVIGWGASAIPNLGPWFTPQANLTPPNIVFRSICAVVSLTALVLFIVSVLCDFTGYRKSTKHILALASATGRSVGKSTEFGENVQALVDALLVSDPELFRYESSDLYRLLVLLDKKKPGKDALNAWDNPDLIKFTAAAQEVLCIVARQIK